MLTRNVIYGAFSMGMSSATKQLSVAIRGQGGMEDGDGGEKLCVRALFKDGGVSPKAMETRSNKDQDGSHVIETRSMMDNRHEMKNERHDISKNFKNSRRFMGQKPAEVFRTDFISAMKIPDTHQFAAGDYLTLSDTWRQEWEKGVQVPVAPEKIPKPAVRKVKSVLCREEIATFTLPSKRISFKNENYVSAFHRSTTSCDYDLDDIDTCWLKETKAMGETKKGSKLDELTMERAITFFERQCFDKMAHQVATKEGLSIEYDETTTCNVCLSPDAEDGNEIIFCDACNMCAHQHCYGVLEIPEGTWLCNPCSRGSLSPPCCLCPNKGGAMKRMKDSLEWIHVICAWWVPEVKIEDTRFIERITKDKIPATRWNLTCSICWEKTGACIQCSVKRCVRAYHITCAVKCGLEMKTVVDPEKDDVQHISFCSKHCTPEPPESNPHSKPTGEEVQNNRQRELQKLQDEFYTLVSVNKASRELRLTKEMTRKMISYWTMKRRHNNNQPLIPLTIQQEEKLSGKQGVVLLQQQRTLEMERFLLLRQDLERLRNLCYMIVRREKMRKELHRSSIDIFLQQNKILLDDTEDLSGDNIDFIRHRTTKFTKFSENYETEKEHRVAQGKHFKFFDDSSTEEEGALLSSIIERINPEDFDRPICTKSSTTDSKKPQPKPLVNDTPKVSVTNKDSSTKPAFSRKHKKFINPPTRRSTRLDGILGCGNELGSFIAEDIDMMFDSTGNDKSVKTEYPEYNGIDDSVLTKVKEVKVEVVDSKALIVGQELAKAVKDSKLIPNEKDIEIDSTRNIFDVTNDLIESAEGNKLDGAITTLTVKQEGDDMEANAGQLFAELRTTCKDTEIMDVDNVEEATQTTGGHTVGSERIFSPETNCRSVCASEVELDSSKITTKTNNIFDVADVDIDRSTAARTTPTKTKNVVNGSVSHDEVTTTKTDRNIFELLSPKKEDEDYHSWSNGPTLTPLVVMSTEAEADEKPVLNYCSTPCLDEKASKDCNRERLVTKSSPTDVKENAFDNFSDFLNDQVRHHNGFATPPGYTTPPFSDENDCRQANDERNRKCLDTEYSLKQLQNNCVLTNSSLFKRKNKRLRNILKYEGKARRNSPRLHHHHRQPSAELDASVEDVAPVMGPVSPSKDSFERLSKLIIETKRRRLNSSGSDYTATKIKEEPPDYVRITRSRVVHSQVTTTA